MRIGSVGGMTSNIVLACTVAGTALAADMKKTTVGIVETVRLNPGNMTLEAKIDTGADGTSLSAQHIENFGRDGKPWVRFVVPVGDARQELELPLVRSVKIKRRNDAPPLTRPVVRLKICLGDKSIDADVNLTDRSRFRYPMLVGVNVLAGRAVVDPQHKNLTTPRCEDPAK